MNRRFRIFALVLMLLSVCFASAQQVPPPPDPARLVNDYTNTLTTDQVNALEQKLVELDDSTSTQIAVVMVPTTDGYDVADYALELGRKWGVGGKEFNNGIILLVAKNDRRLHIATGYGLEGSLPDATASHIIEDVIVPNFRGDDYYRGINEGTDAIIAAVKGKYSVPRTKGGGGGILPFIFIIAVIIFIILISGGGKGGQFMSRRGSRGWGGPVIFPTGGGWGTGGGGGWSGGGGGFGGFGGGSFGGGGASGGW